MSELTLRPMAPNEFDVFRSGEIRDYAIEQVRAGYWREEEAEARSAKQTDSLLPQGIETPEMLLLIVEKVDGIAIGRLPGHLDAYAEGTAQLGAFALRPGMHIPCCVSMKILHTQYAPNNEVATLSIPLANES